MKPILCRQLFANWLQTGSPFDHVGQPFIRRDRYADDNIPRPTSWAGRKNNSISGLVNDILYLGLSYI